MNTPNQSNFPEPPSFDTVSVRLQAILFDKIVEALQEGTLHVSEYAKWQAEGIDFALAPNLVRHKAKRSLISSGQDTKDEEEADASAYDVKEVSNNGLYTIAPGYNVRILKSAEDGSVPSPGMSVTRKNFYKQDQALLDFPERRNGNERVQPVWNLIVHWTVDAEYNLLKLSVALPLRCMKNETGRTVVECAFDEPFWQRPPQSAVIAITDAPIPDAPRSLDLNIVADEEKTGEEPKDE
jgi:hypothetical protein